MNAVSIKRLQTSMLPDAILVDFGVQKSVLLDAVTGAYIPSRHLPVVLPKDMETVEPHCEDVATDIEPYQDEDGHVYSLGYGLEAF